MSIISCDNQGLNIFIIFFTNSCDPFEVHAKHKIKKSRKKSSAISSEFAKGHGLIPGKKICN